MADFEIEGNVTDFGIFLHQNRNIRFDGQYVNTLVTPTTYWWTYQQRHLLYGKGTKRSY